MTADNISRSTLVDDAEARTIAPTGHGAFIRLQ